MPATEHKLKGGGYSVSTPDGVHAKHTTKAKAEAQVRLLNAIDHGFVPRGVKPHHSGKGDNSPDVPGKLPASRKRPDVVDNSRDPHKWGKHREGSHIRDHEVTKSTPHPGHSIE